MSADRKKGELVLAKKHQESQFRDFHVMPVDVAILERLPDEGGMLGFHHLAKSVKSLGAEMRDGHVTSPQLNGRLRLLRDHGFVVAVPIQPAGTAGWQRTAAGRKLTEGGK